MIVGRFRTDPAQLEKVLEFSRLSATLREFNLLVKELNPPVALVTIRLSSRFLFPESQHVSNVYYFICVCVEGGYVCVSVCV